MTIQQSKQVAYVIHYVPKVSREASVGSEDPSFAFFPPKIYQYVRSHALWARLRHVECFEFSRGIFAQFPHFLGFVLLTTHFWAQIHKKKLSLESGHRRRF